MELIEAGDEVLAPMFSCLEQEAHCRTFEAYLFDCSQKEKLMVEWLA